MDLIVFNPPQNAPFVATNLQNASAVSGYLTASWIERYRDPGEFEVKAKLSSGLREKLPIGSLVSHLNTFEVMVVENHSVKDAPNKDTEISITGRSLEAVILENRVVGGSLPYETSIIDHYLDYAPYVLSSASLGSQLQTMMLQHFGDVSVGDPNALQVADRIPDLTADYDISTPTVSVERIIDRGTVHSKMLELMATEDYGLRIIRQHSFASKFSGGRSDDRTVFLVHDGVDRRSQVIFSAENGEIDSADYLWSNRKLKTSIVLTGQYLEVHYTIPGAPTDMSKRYMHEVASDLDRDYEPGVSSLAVKTAILESMVQRAKEILAGQKDIALVSASVSRMPNTKFKYRDSYDIGDIVMVRGSYGESSPMRVIEYAEFDDEDKSVGYPTLAKLKE